MHSPMLNCCVEIFVLHAVFYVCYFFKWVFFLMLRVAHGLDWNDQLT